MAIKQYSIPKWLLSHILHLLSFAILEFHTGTQCTPTHATRQKYIQYNVICEQYVSKWEVFPVNSISSLDWHSHISHIPGCRRIFLHVQKHHHNYFRGIGQVYLFIKDDKKVTLFIQFISHSQQYVFCILVKELYGRSLGH